MNEPTRAQNNTPGCGFDPATLQFAGSPREQARCLLRPVMIGGKPEKKQQKLPRPFENLVGEKVKVQPEILTAWLKSEGIDPNDIGGDLSLPLASAELPSGESIRALYFVIHDTSSPYLKDAPFPKDFDTNPDWRGNDLSIWIKQPVAHVFVNRLGKSITTTPFSVPVAKGFGTKYARDFLGAKAKGMQIHIELIQPRKRDPNTGGPNNDRIAPVPGFTGAQYRRLAVLYTAASVRRGIWLIPAFHAAVDEGIPDAHDDPQNFELKTFAVELRRIISRLQ